MSDPRGPTGPDDRPTDPHSWTDPTGPPADLTGTEPGPNDRWHRRGRPGHERWRGGPPWWQGGRGRPGPPPWWPEGEAWPPSGEAWVAMRRRFFMRLALVATAVFLLAVVAPIVLLWHFLTGLGIHPGIAGAFSLLVALALLGTLGRMGGGVRGIAVPLGDLIEAAGRVESGDYSARVPEARRGPRELRGVTRAFNAMAARLEADERQRRTLLADVSHELRTPLAVLQGELEAMVDGVHPADEDHLGATLEETRVLSRLVEDLRTLALAESGALTLHREPTDLGVLAGEVVAGFEALALDAGVRIGLLVADDVPLVDVDPVRIRQVVSNLIANALRYAPAGSAVGVDIRALDGRISVSVADAGPGIPPELLPKLFDRFAKSPESRGSGLGLAIAKELVEAHGGRIEAIQPPEGGTIIRFELPQ